MPCVSLSKQQHERPGDLKSGYDQHPCQLRRGIHFAVEQINHYYQREDYQSAIKMMHVIFQHNKRYYHNRQLQQKQKNYNEKSAEYKRQYSLSFWFCKA